MSFARVTELSATSETGFKDAIDQAIARSTKTLRGVEGAWVKDMNVMIEDGNIKGYKANVEITFQLEDPSLNPIPDQSHDRARTFGLWPFSFALQNMRSHNRLQETDPSATLPSAPRHQQSALCARRPLTAEC